MTTIHEIIPAALAGERLDRVVALITGASRADAAALVAAGDARVNGAPVTARAHRLAQDDDLAVDWDPVTTETTLDPDATVAFAVVYADDDVIVIDKPAGLVVHPGAGNDEHTLVNGLLARFPEIEAVGQEGRPGIVHRLDKETSGLLMVARSPVAYDGLVAQLSARDVHRHYQALVWGHFDVPSGMIDAPIGRSTRQGTRMSVTEGGKPAITRYDVQQRYGEPVALSLVACRLETGRTHQIRVHLEAIGHPVVGDDRYHGTRESFVVPRLFLHAASLGFVHPVTGEELSFSSPLPDDLAGVLDRLTPVADDGA